jgi:chaperonin GroES
MMNNPSGIRATEYKVLIDPEKIEDELLKKYEGLKKAGFQMGDEERDKRQAAATKGKIIDISPLAFKYDDWPSDERIPKNGDRVAFARYAGVSIEGADGENYRLINDKDVIAILDF